MTRIGSSSSGAGPAAKSPRIERAISSAVASRRVVSLQERASSSPRQRPSTVLVFPTSTARSGAPAGSAAAFTIARPRPRTRSSRRASVLRRRNPAGSSPRYSPRTSSLARRIVSTSPGRWSEASSQARISSSQRGRASSASSRSSRDCRRPARGMPRPVSSSMVVEFGTASASERPSTLIPTPTATPVSPPCVRDSVSTPASLRRPT